MLNANDFKKKQIIFLFTNEGDKLSFLDMQKMMKKILLLLHDANLGFNKALFNNIIFVSLNNLK